MKTRFVPDSVGEVPGGAADLADEVTEDWAGHQAGTVLQGMAGVLGFRLPIGLAEFTVAHSLGKVHHASRANKRAETWTNLVFSVEGWWRE